MSAAELRRVGRRITEELLSQGDLAVADELFAADYVEHHPAGPQTVGPSGVKRLVTELRRAFPDLYGYVEDQLVHGGTVGQRITVTGTHTGMLIGLAGTGRRITFDVMLIARVGPDGKIAESWSLWDQLSVLRQLGVRKLPLSPGTDMP